MSKATEKENLEADVANMKFDAGADEDPFMKVKGLVMGLISRLRDESSSQANNQKAYCNEEMSKHVEVSKVFSQNRVQQHFGGQIVEPPAISLAGKIVKVPVSETQEKTQQVANTHVQHAINTVKVEKPKIIKQTMQKPVIQEKINQMTKHIDVPPLQFTEKIVDIPVVAQRQVHVHWKLQKTMEISHLQYIDDQVRVVAKTVEIPQSLFSEKIVAIPEVRTVQGTQTSESFREILMGGVAPNIEDDSFIDDFSSVDSKGLRSPRLRGTISCLQAKRQHAPAPAQPPQTRATDRTGEAVADFSNTTLRRRERRSSGQDGDCVGDTSRRVCGTHRR